MARKEKILNKISIDNVNSFDRREVGYYATPSFISDYIGNRMFQINSKGKKVLDPCCGKEELISFFLSRDFIIDGIDIIKHKKEYKCNFYQRDFIEYYCDKKEIVINDGDKILEKDKKIQLDYDFYIANPPYNCHEVNYIRDNKKKLKGYFQDVGLHNMYSMFLSSIIDFAKEGAVIGLIICDSFFTSKHHKNLRKKIIDKCIIHEITMCPTDLFLSEGADVRTSILILEKRKDNNKNKESKIIVNNRSLDSLKLKEVLKSNISGQYKKYYSIKDVVLLNEKDNLEFIIECPNDISKLFNNKRLGEIFPCVTGISTGNDKLYLCNNRCGDFIIPFYKNPGKDRFYTEKIVYLHKDFLNLDKNIKNFIVRNKKLLYKSGITCSSMGVEFTASILPENSTYGVNSNIICNDDDKWWLVAYLNSNLVTYLVRGVLIRSNMITSGYVSRIPLLYLSDEKKKMLKALAKEAYDRRVRGKTINNILEEINKIINNSAKISKESIEFISSFKSNLIKST